MAVPTLTLSFNTGLDGAGAIDAAREGSIDARALFSDARRLRARKNSNSSSKIMAPATMPTMIPISAPLEEELELLFAMLTGVVYLKHVEADTDCCAWFGDAPGYGAKYDMIALAQYMSPS